MRNDKLDLLPKIKGNKLALEYGGNIADSSENRIAATHNGDADFMTETQHENFC